MAQVNYELDLRIPESRNRNKFLQSKTFKVLLFLLAFTLLIAFCFMLDGYRLKLQAETVFLQNELAAKTEMAVPLMAMSAELDTYKRRLEIGKNHFGRYLIKNKDLQAIKKTILPGLSISYLAVDAEGNIEIRGSCTTLYSAALYAKKLQELPFICKAELAAADLDENSSGFYSIIADLIPTAGGDGAEQLQ